MIQTISRNAEKILVGLFTLVLLFHVCILLKFIPYSITWGGRLKSDSEMYVFETVSILTILPLYVVLLVEAKWVNISLSQRVVTVVLWLYTIIFALNTIGNLFAVTTFEKLFTIVTLGIAILLTLILKKKA